MDLGSHLRDASQEGGATVVARLLAPRAYKLLRMFFPVLVHSTTFYVI
jgi:hypothetical protein